jgi:phenylacetic acid degradation operon negative regulatory protein
MSSLKRNIEKQHIKTMQSSVMIFTLFGAFILPRRELISMRSLIQLVKPLGLSENAIRLVVSRMKKKGWLETMRHGRKSDVRLTPAGLQMVSYGKTKAFDIDHPAWDGYWRLCTYSIPEHWRKKRDHLRHVLKEAQYGTIGASVWISPRPHAQTVIDLIRTSKLSNSVFLFTTTQDKLSSSQDIAQHAWPITELEKRYRYFVKKYAQNLKAYTHASRSGTRLRPAHCFAQRFLLTGDYVSIRLEDPMLPLDLLSSPWIGEKARHLYKEHWDILTPEVNRFVDAVIEGRMP